MKKMEFIQTVKTTSKDESATTDFDHGRGNMGSDDGNARDDTRR